MLLASTPLQAKPQHCTADHREQRDDPRQHGEAAIGRRRGRKAGIGDGRRRRADRGRWACIGQCRGPLEQILTGRPGPRALRGCRRADLGAGGFARRGRGRSRWRVVRCRRRLDCWSISGPVCRPSDRPLQAEVGQLTGADIARLGWRRRRRHNDGIVLCHRRPSRERQGRKRPGNAQRNPVSSIQHSILHAGPIGPTSPWLQAGRS